MAFNWGAGAREGLWQGRRSKGLGQGGDQLQHARWTGEQHTRRRGPTRFGATWRTGGHMPAVHQAGRHRVSHGTGAGSRFGGRSMRLTATAGGSDREEGGGVAGAGAGAGGARATGRREAAPAQGGRRCAYAGAWRRASSPPGVVEGAAAPGMRDESQPHVQ